MVAGACPSIRSAGRAVVAPRRVLVAAVVASLSALAAPGLASGAAVDFATDVRPLLQRHCYECHGPTKRKGDLRLTNRADAFTAGNLGIPVIDPGSARTSVLIDLVTSDDPEARMPKGRAPLSADEIALLRRWIDEGAAWPDGADAPHWAYVAPRRTAPPDVRDTSWPRRPIDRFVLARLEREGIAPAPEAEPAALLRRLHLDLTGLPPAPDEVDAFLRDPSPAAYDRVVDELLARPDFGERWASEWLDLAHYADSTGFMSEVTLSNWPYRDWVIDAINADMPFDRFTIEQLAGDLLPAPTLSQQVATGFLRAPPLNLEAGVREEDARVAQVIDRVNTIGTAWLGTTVACAQCHDHRYDPISQVEYYRLLAFVNGTEREAVSKDGHGGAHLIARGPTVELPPPERARRRAVEITERFLDDLDAGLAAPGSPAPLTPDERASVLAEARESGMRGALGRGGAILLARLAQQRGDGWWQPWLDDAQARLRAGEPRWEPLEVVSFEVRAGQTTAPSHRILDDGSILLDGPPPDQGSYVVELRGLPRTITGLRIETLNDPSLPAGGPGRAAGTGRQPFVVSEVTLERTGRDGEQPVVLSGAIASTGVGRTAPANVLDDDPSSGWSYDAGALRAEQWLDLVAQSGIEPRAGGGLRLTIHQLAGAGQMIGRLRVSATTAAREVVAMPAPFRKRVRDQRWEDLSGFDRVVLLTLARQALLPVTIASFDRALRAGHGLEQPVVAHVIREIAEPRATHVFERGDHRVPGVAVTAGTPGVLPAMDDDLPRNRLGLARWLVDRANPLTARVVVNRWWGLLLGAGLVATPEDFGMRGERPSHPELLDWLAVFLMESGWSRKAVVREIVRSATYRQGPVPADLATLARDPSNRLLAHHPPRRLPAESIRDNALQIAGLLSTARGGPAVFPPQPPGVWRSNGHTLARYTPSDGADAYRRGVYVVWRRTAPYPSFVAFDAGDRTACVVTRSESNTPLQALTLLNDEVYVEAALAFADRLLRERPGAGAHERLTYAFRLALAREPSSEERAILLRLLDDRLASRDRAATDATVGSIPRFTPSPRVDPHELAAWFHVTRVILNLDETISRG